MRRQIKVNISFAGHLAGKIIDLECDDRGNIIDQFWNARMCDSKVDGCVEFVEMRQKESRKKHTNED